MRKIIRKFLKLHTEKKLWYKVFVSLAAVVVFSTTYMLILPALTQEAKTYCGKEVHTHTDECYTVENKLVCGKEESEGHKHSDSCYKTEKVLVCTSTEEGHEHTDACYKEEKTLICGKEESDGHKHTESCYKESKKLTCDKKEHEHTLACFSNPSADVESKSDWEGTLKNVNLTGIWADDVIAVAKSQLGYKESTKNYEVEEDGKTMRGYTRYGAWYGDEYGDWCAMYASFCLHYAGVDTSEFPEEASCSKWIEKLNKKDLYHKASGKYEPQAGDLVFFNTDNEDGADHVGIITEIKKNKDGEITTITTIEGNSSDQVKENDYEPGDSSILGYGELPENPKLAKASTEEKAEATTEAKAEAATEATTEATTEKKSEDTTEEKTEATTEESTESQIVADASKDTVVKKKVSLLKSVLKVFGASGDSVTYTTLPISSSTGSGTTYDKTTGKYTTTLRTNFSMSGSDAQKKYFVVNYPEGIIIPDDVLGERILMDGELEAGTYTFVKNADGTYSAQIVFNDDYLLKKVGDTVTGYVQFEGTLDDSFAQDNGEISVPSIGLVIPASEIAYPAADETVHYNIDSTKSGAYDANTDTLTYTVYLLSTKGTKEINFTDTISNLGDVTFGTPTITLEKVTSTGFVNKYNKGTTTKTETIDVVPSYTDNTLTATFPALKGTQADGTTEYYKITYTYDVSNVSGIKISPNNAATASSKDTVSGESITDTSTYDNKVAIDKTYTLSKSGKYNSTTSDITWTITVNTHKQDIAGSVIYDDMFNDAVSFSGIDSSAYDWVYENGKKVGIKFKATDGTVNKNQYTIYYTTSAVNNDWAEKKVENTATFDKDGNTSTTGDQITGPSTVTVPGGSVTKTQNGATVDLNTKTAVIKWTVSFNHPSGTIPAGTVITDDPTVTSWNSGSQYLTREQIQSWGGKFEWKNSAGTTVGSAIDLTDSSNGTITFKGSDGNTYTYKELVEKNDPTLTFTVATITFNKAFTAPADATNLTYSYSTTADLSKTDKVNFINKVTINDEPSAQANWEYKAPSVKKTDENGSTSTTTKTNSGTLTWKVEAQTGNADNYTYLTMHDQIPTGLKLTKLTLDNGITLTLNEDGTITGSGGSLTVSGTWTTSEVNVKLTGTIPQKTTYNFTITCAVDEDNLAALTKNSSGQYTFANTAKVSTDKGDLGEASQTQNWKSDEDDGDDTEKGNVTKGATWDKDNHILKYSVSINRNKEDLVEGSDTVTFNDVLSYNGYDTWSGAMNVSLMRTTVKLYYAQLNDDGTPKLDDAGELIAGDEVTDWSWTTSTDADTDWYKTTKETLTGVIPDNTALVLKYSYQVSIEKTSVTQTGTGISNIISFEGSDYTAEDERTSDQWQVSSASGGVTTDKHYTFYKVESGNFGKGLNGAIFKLESSSDGKVWVDTGKTYTTTDDGKFDINWNDGTGYEYNKLYRVTEVTPPSGYELPETPPSYIFYFSNSSVTLNTLPSTLPTGAFDLTVNGNVAYVENTRENSGNTELTVEKKWVDLDGSTALDESTEVKFKLYQVQTTGDNVTTVDLGKEYALNTSNEWTTSITDLPRSSDDGSTVYTYYVQEESTDYLKNNFDVYYSDNNASPGISRGTITITNKKKPTTDKTTITVDKKWFDATGEEVTDTSKKPSIKFTLKQVAVTGDKASTTDYGTYTLNGTESTPWEWVSGDLPLVSDDGNTVYKYYVEEEAMDDYTTTYVNNGSKSNPGTSSGTITIKNTADYVVGLKVRKNWYDKDGNKVTKNNGSISFELYQVATDVPKTAKLTFIEQNYSNSTLSLVLDSRSVPIGSEVTVHFTRINSNNVSRSNTTITGSEKISQTSDGSNGCIIVFKMTEDTVITAYSYGGSESSRGIQLDSVNVDTSGVPAQESSEPTLIDTYTITADDGWVWSRDDLPAQGTDADGNTVTYEYYVVETPVTNYTTTYENNNTVNDVITIKNTKLTDEEEEYVLPTTGGFGTTLYTMGGALLLASALGIYFFKRRRYDI